MLHTWGSALTHHPHVHCIVPGGGLSPDGQRWIACRKGFFLPVRVLSRFFRRLFLEKLADAHARGRLRFFGALTSLAAPPAFAVLDMRLEDGNGLQVVEAIQIARPDARVIMMTGYGAISTAVAAVKAGAIDYLPKPADADDVVRALLARQDEAPAPPENPMSADRVRWEHIQRVYELCGHNVSETARRLNMHRRTLQRILAKRAPR